MIKLIRANASNKDFKALVVELDKELAIIDGDDHAFYAKLNKTADNIDVVVAYIDDEPVGCGAIRPYSEQAMELKRMFTPKQHRGKGIASAIVKELEARTKELGYKYCVLETGKRQPWAVSLYKSLGFKEVPNFGHYANDDNSVCFEKKL